MVKVATGLSSQEAARALECAPSMVGNAVRRFAEAGRAGLQDRRRENGQRVVTEAFLARLERVLVGTPQDCGWLRTTWTREKLCLELERRGLKRVSVATMGRALSRLGAGLKRPQPVVLCPWPAWKRDRRLWEFRCRAASARTSEPVVYADEMDVHLNPKVGRDWMLKGHRRLLVTPGNNKKRFVAGALDARSGRLTWVSGKSKASGLFIALLSALDAAYASARRVHVILDNAAIHTSKKTRKALEKLGGRLILHFLPLYCPQGNRIERVWWDVHANVTRNHRRKNIQALMRDVDAYLAARNAELDVTTAPLAEMSWRAA